MAFDRLKRRTYLGSLVGGLGSLAGCPGTRQKQTEQRTTSEESSRYTPSYSIPDQTPVDIGAAYLPWVGGDELDLPWVGGDEWDDCIDGQPAVGAYGDPPQPSTVTRQIDLARGFGISRWKVTTNDANDYRFVDVVAESPLKSSISLELSYDLKNVIEGEWSLKSEIRTVRKYLNRLPSAGQRDGRPVVYLQRLSEWSKSREGFVPHPAITSEFESPEAFVSTVRAELTTEQGTPPYLVGELVQGGDYEDTVTDEYRRFAAQFDAIENDLWDPGEGSVSWSSAYQKNVDILFAGRSFADDLSIDFVPNVYPGWNHRIDVCRDSEERIPRSPSHLKAMLRLAVLFSTRNWVNIDSFNDWTNGTQIEPGTVGGTSYGTEYLTAVKSFQADAADGGRSVYYVSPDGSDSNAGSKEDPLGTIQHGLLRATAGDTVHVLPGEYSEGVRTVRPGEAGKPITITGPKDAVFRGDASFEINHSHVHLRGLTFDGLIDPDRPDDIESYAESLLQINEELRNSFKHGSDNPRTVPEEEYLTDIVVKPHAVGNVGGDAVKISYSKNVEIGEFRVIGPAGVDHLKGDKPGHNGEIIYMGTVYSDGFPLDFTHNVHVHHIDNSAGHPHAELVDVKGGCHNILIEYCTDAGGAGRYLPPGKGDELSGERAIKLAGRECTLRWNVIENSNGYGVQVGQWGAAQRNRYEEASGRPFPEELYDSGRKNSIYGNRIVDYGELAIGYLTVHTEGEGDHIAEDYGPDDQRHVCGNTINGPTHGNPDKACPGSVPTTETIGHLGGESPWS